MTQQSQDPNYWQNIVFHSMFPSVFVGPCLIRESGPATPAQLPKQEAFPIGDEYEINVLTEVLNHFENEMTSHRQNNALYLKEVSKRFEQAWQHEEYYKNLIAIVWEKWIRKEEELIADAGEKIREVYNTFFGISFDFINPDIPLPDEEYNKVDTYRSQMTLPIDRIKAFQHYINNAKAAVYFIQHTKAIITYYSPVIPKKLNSASSLPPASDEHLTFESYINDEYKAKLILYLQSKYTNARPGEIALMLFAVNDLTGVTNTDITGCNQTELHKALSATFGSIGQRTSLNEAITRMKLGTKNGNGKIQQHKKRIIGAMEH